MDNAKGLSTPVVLGLKLSKIGHDNMTNPHQQRSIVGALQYATVPRPEISFSVNKAYQFVQQPLKTHWKAVKCILCYLSGTLVHSLHLLKPTSPLGLRGFCNVDWASDIDHIWSTSCAGVFVGGNLATWCSKKQPLVAKSSTDLVVEIVWLESLPQEMNVRSPRPVFYCDNLSTVMLVHNPILHSRTEHMELNLFFVREGVMQNKVLITHIPSTEQPVDILSQ